jgi:hypothetical protein
VAFGTAFEPCFYILFQVPDNELGHDNLR